MRSARRAGCLSNRACLYFLVHSIVRSMDSGSPGSTEDILCSSPREVQHGTKGASHDGQSFGDCPRERCIGDDDHTPTSAFTWLSDQKHLDFYRRGLLKTTVTSASQH